ncbi:Malto-oligosyltrehalose synthase (plasmid) [Sinorhizobium sojae CCBAU 05684]|uniref:Malto-oligosyltrehalose synthase n=1 Tax=Sinorhizobium sojae CCBAU 05684 TaxID=716928 RepID=A0A249PJX6_9HYPH|nr:malto-oligosyltrehalose synthase [Sinorhizobium sojae]ASY66211.1 Malto-oligosyltrehalose synthase [Sinorhizobium sojae CCBAU 05684]
MHSPDATYRLQFRNGMDFAKAVELIPHFVALGISHLYASPIFTAVEGSTHGYDVVNYNEIDPALGGENGFRSLVAALKAQGLGIVLDIVPNHMAAHLENGWWHTVVEWGRDSAYADHFDIDWHQRLTLPFLGRSFDEELAAGTVRVAFDRGRNCLALGYYGAHYPLHPASYGQVLEGAHPSLGKFVAIAAASEPAEADRFHARLATLLQKPAAIAALDEQLATFSADRRRMQDLHALQPWRLMDWRSARDHLSYRRFFEIAGLVGVRVEDPAVFADTHRLALDLVREGLVDGLRIDHVDGLADPEQYLNRLRQAVGNRTFLVVEKILEAQETLPPEWPVEGATGYEFISALVELLADEEASLLWNETSGAQAASAVRDCKLMLLRHNFNAEVTRLARLMGESAGDGTAEAIRQLFAALAVYRTYVTDRGATARDRRIIEEIAAKASDAAPAVQTEIDQVAAALLDPAGRPARGEFRTRFQQSSGAVMAKAVEDTFFYRRGDYLAANEVGADPCWRPGGPRRFHAMMLRRASEMPKGLSATSTHDTKRGEDARARLYVISEAPELWANAVLRWHEINAGAIRSLPSGEAPEASVEQFLYQSLLGTWPVAPIGEGSLSALSERMHAFAIKAVREAKLRTSWDGPDEHYEAAVTAFLAKVLDWRNRAFLEDFGAVARPFIRAGLVNSLSQTLVKLTAPGIPDIYQGSERLDLSLVDPDNRRAFTPVSLPAEAPRNPTEGNFEDCKQWLIAECLRFRRQTGADLMRRGDYRPVEVEGPGARHAVAFMRLREQECAITVVPRLVFGHLDETRLLVGTELWRETGLLWPEDGEPRQLQNLLTGRLVAARRRLPLGEIFGGFPVAFLVQA